MSEILHRYWFVIVLPALVCLGCRGNSPSAASGDGDPETEESVDTPPEDLEPGEVEASGEFAAPAKALMERLKATYPGLEFSLGWTAARVHVTIHEGPTSEDATKEAARDRKDRHERIIGMCLASTAPATKEIWVSSKSATGSAYSDKGDWGTYERLLGAD